MHIEVVMLQCGVWALPTRYSHDWKTGRSAKYKEHSEICKENNHLEKNLNSLKGGQSAAAWNTGEISDACAMSQNQSFLMQSGKFKVNGKSMCNTAQKEGTQNCASEVMKREVSRNNIPYTQTLKVFMRGNKKWFGHWRRSNSSDYDRSVFFQSVFGMLN